MKPFETNAAAARFLLMLHAATHDTRFRDAALRAVASAAEPGLPERFHARTGALLLAVEEALAPWVSVAVVGEPGDAAGDAFWRAVLSADTPFVVRERTGLGTAEGSSFPPSPSPAAYLCGEGRCSPPVTEPKALSEAVRSFRRP